MTNAKKRLSVVLAAIVLVATFTLVFSTQADAGPSGITHHTRCDGTFAFDHGMTYDGIYDNQRWYHTMVRTFTNPYYSVVRYVYRLPAGATLKIFDHSHGATNCPFN